jgi:hypothetical protein
MRITANHPVRKAVAELPTYYSSMGCALHAVHAACDDNNIEVDVNVGCADYSAETGRVNITLRPKSDVCDCCGNQLGSEAFDNVVIFSWYVMDSGRIKLTAYVS